MGSSHQPKFIKEIYHWDFYHESDHFFLEFDPLNFHPLIRPLDVEMSGAPLKMRIERRLAAMQENYPEFICGISTCIWVICIR